MTSIQVLLMDYYLHLKLSQELNDLVDCYLLMMILFDSHEMIIYLKRQHFSYDQLMMLMNISIASVVSAAAVVVVEYFYLHFLWSQVHSPLLSHDEIKLQQMQ